jgi:hypothetical protein
VGRTDAAGAGSGVVQGIVLALHMLFPGFGTGAL